MGLHRCAWCSGARLARSSVLLGQWPGAWHGEGPEKQHLPGCGAVCSAEGPGRGKADTHTAVLTPLKPEACPLVVKPGAPPPPVPEPPGGRGALSLALGPRPSEGKPPVPHWGPLCASSTPRPGLCPGSSSVRPGWGPPSEHGCSRAPGRPAFPTRPCASAQAHLGPSGARSPRAGSPATPVLWDSAVEPESPLRAASGLLTGCPLWVPWGPEKRRPAGSPRVRLGCPEESSATAPRPHAVGTGSANLPQLCQTRCGTLWRGTRRAARHSSGVSALGDSGPRPLHS